MTAINREMTATISVKRDRQALAAHGQGNQQQADDESALCEGICFSHARTAVNRLAAQKRVKSSSRLQARNACLCRCGLQGTRVFFPILAMRLLIKKTKSANS